MPTESQIVDAELRARIGRLIDEARLPLMKPTRIFAGAGSGTKCAGCGQPMTADQVEYEVPPAQTGVSVHLHLGCFVLWQLECTARTRGASKSPDLSPT